VIARETAAENIVQAFYPGGQRFRRRVHSNVTRGCTISRLGQCYRLRCVETQTSLLSCVKDRVALPFDRYSGFEPRQLLNLAASLFAKRSFLLPGYMGAGLRSKADGSLNPQYPFFLDRLTGQHCSHISEAGCELS
jgi:hypothetical protein